MKRSNYSLTRSSEVYRKFTISELQTLYYNITNIEKKHLIYFTFSLFTTSVMYTKLS